MHDYVLDIHQSRDPAVRMRGKSLCLCMRHCQRQPRSPLVQSGGGHFGTDLLLYRPIIVKAHYGTEELFGFVDLYVLNHIDKLC